MKSKIVFCGLLIFFYILGCGREQQMLKPAIQPMPDSNLPNEVTPTEEPPVVILEEPTALVDYQIDGITKQQVVFTSAQAALESEQLKTYIEYCKAYNERFCGENLKEGLTDEAMNNFNFENRLDPPQFAALVLEMYPGVFSESPLIQTTARPDFPWWTASLYPRCF